MQKVAVYLRICLAILLGLGTVAWAQTVTGSVTGTVTDATGSVLAGAKVSVVNQATGVTSAGETNNAGIYYIQYLRVGQYKMTITAPGFKVQSYGPFALEINQEAKINAQLKIGEASEVVTVTDTLAPIINAENATLASTIDSNTIANIPINAQNFMSLTQFMPGSVNTEPAVSTGALPSGRADERYTSDDSVPSFNGNRSMSNNFIFDGVEINETLNNTAAFGPNTDAIEQFQVITGNASAEFGNANGGLVIVVTKGGTNKWMGSVNAYLENDKLDANTWANKYSGAAKSHYTHAIYDGTLGGPIKRDKLFFFVDYEGMRYHTGGESSVSVAPKEWRTGDFSSLLSVLGTQLYDSQNGFAAYTGNQSIPINNPVAKYLFNNTDIYPEPNQSPSAGTVATNNYLSHYKQYNTNDQGDARIDWKVGNSDTVFGRLTIGQAGDAEPVAPLAIDFPSSDNYPFYGGVVSWTHIFTSSLVNEFRAGISRSIYDEGHTTDSTGLFGTTGNKVLGIPGTQTQPGFSEMEFADGLVSNVGSMAWMVNMHENNYTYADNVSWQHGQHMIKSGVQLIRYQQNYMFPGNSGALGAFNYSGQYTGALGGTGSSFADFVLDESYEATVGASYGYVGQRQWRSAVYVQDDWKATSALKFNLGLRWEFFQPIYEVNDKQVNIEPAESSKSGVPTLVYAGKDGNSRALYEPTFANFEPRFGFAYQVNPRWVVRGGYGITNYLEGTGTALRLTQNYPYNYSYDNIAGTPSATSTGNPISISSGFGSSIPTTSSTTYYMWDKHLKPSLTQQFNLTLEYEINNDTSASVGYVGQLGQHLIDAVPANQWKTIGDSSTAPYKDLVGIDGTTLGSNGTVKATTSASMMNYNGLQAVLRHRAAKGLEFTVNYTYSKAMTNYTGFYASLGTNGASNYWEDPYHPSRDYGPAYTDIRQSLNGTGVYDLPFGTGKRWGANWNKTMEEVAGGWKLGMTATFFSGLPVSIISWGEVDANAIQWAQHANQYRKMKIHNRTVGAWFGTDKSATPCSAAFTGSSADNGYCAYGDELSTAYGTAGVNTERAPGYRQADFSVFKSFALVHGEKLDFRSDFFNAFNLASYGNPSNYTTWGYFGQITGTRSPQRQIQFALKYNF